MPSTPKKIACLALALASVPLLGAGSGAATEPEIGAYEIDLDAMCRLMEMWGEQLLEKHGVGAWAPMKMELDDEALALMGLPDKDWLVSHSFAVPTAVLPDGTTAAAALPPVASYAGAGCFGIRPGALLLTITPEVIGWCSLAHVYGAPGSYQISTAGHCGNVGDRATVIAAFAPSGVPILLDFGKYAKSTGDGGIGKDWALIGIEPQFQHLVSPTMCAWGGPIGMFTKTGATASFSYSRSNLVPTVGVNPDPLLPQAILHYGHGAGLGMPVGTARVGEAIDWRATYFTWFGAISPGDSGSGSNTATGDALATQREAAGINTHIYLDGIQPFKTGTGYLASTRATIVPAALANGQLLPYPAPVPGAP